MKIAKYLTLAVTSTVCDKLLTEATFTECSRELCSALADILRFQTSATIETHNAATVNCRTQSEINHCTQISQYIVTGRCTE